MGQSGKGTSTEKESSTEKEKETSTTAVSGGASATVDEKIKRPGYTSLIKKVTEKQETIANLLDEIVQKDEQIKKLQNDKTLLLEGNLEMDTKFQEMEKQLQETSTTAVSGGASATVDEKIKRPGYT